MLRAFVDEYHSNWESMIPALLYAYHNTVHSATGYTPHHLMFGWTPRDLRAPLISGVTSDFPHISEWAKSRASDFQAAKLHIEHAQAAMIRAHKASDNAHVYQPDDLVKVSTRALPIRMTSTQTVKLLPKYIGPFRVTEVVNPGAYRLDLPATYVAVHDVINQEYLRPWFQSPGRELTEDFPDVQPHPELNPVVQILDRKRHGRAPRSAQPLDIPAKYLVVRVDGTLEWVPLSHLHEDDDLALVKKFEWRFPRSVERPCEPVSAYDISRYATEDPWESDDEVDLGLAEELNARFPGRLS